jgi:NAD(P) transhydrogenase subunit alpha
MIALGAGVAGLQAIATARRLGAVVHGFDVRAAAREQVESLGATFVFPDSDVRPKEGAGGHAGAQTEAELNSLRRGLTLHLAQMNLIVTSAQIPGRSAPILIDDITLEALSAGTVIVDLAAAAGGNTTRTVADEIVTVGKNKIIGKTNLASTHAMDASILFSGNLRALLQHLLDATGRLQLGPDDAIAQALLGDRSRAAA